MARTSRCSRCPRPRPSSRSPAELPARRSSSSTCRRAARARAAAGGDGSTSALDAPVSGGPRGAEAATLTIMVGGRAEDFARARPVLEGARPAGARRRPRRRPGGEALQQPGRRRDDGGARRGLRARDRRGARPGHALRPADHLDRRLARAAHAVPAARGRTPHIPVASGYEPLFALDLIAKDLALARRAGGGAGGRVAARRGCARRLPAAQAAGSGASTTPRCICLQSLDQRRHGRVDRGATPTSRPTRGIAPLMKSISSRRPASRSSSIDGFAPGIFEPKSRT